jgi:hypothetical protein
VSALALLALAAAHLAGGEEDARIAYRLAYDADARAPAWTVAIDGRGFAGVSALVLELEDWGEWLRLDGYYLRALASDPPLVRREQRDEWDLARPEGWDGAFTVRYDLALAELGSPARELFDGLPYRARTYACGVSANTLMQVSWSGGPARAVRTLALDLPAGWTAVTGWGGTQSGDAAISIPENARNTLLSFGEPRAAARAACAGFALEITQWGGERDVTAELAEFARRFLETCTQALGSPPADVLRLVVTEPGQGGTRLDGAIVLGVPEGLGPEHPYTQHFVAHELFHEWLGGRVVSAEGERLAWFWEGFTEYLSLRHLVRAGLAPPAWLAERLREHEAELVRLDLIGAAAFADPEVNWRDPAREPLAYKGSALTAFALDVALRARGEPGLDALVRDLLAAEGGRYTLASLRAWLVARDLAGFWDAHVAAPFASTLAADLVAAGFVAHETPQPLAYVGVRLDQDGPFGTVVAVDPDGPSAGKVQVGDVVSGLTPTREHVAGAEAAAPEYPFGLAYYEADAAEVRVDVERGGERVEVFVAPRRIDGPPRTEYEPGPALAEFFE